MQEWRFSLIVILIIRVGTTAWVAVPSKLNPNLYGMSNKEYIRTCNLSEVNPLDRKAWMAGVRQVPGVAYPSDWDNHSTLNTKTGYDDGYDEVNLA